MLQDVERGRALELDGLIAAAVEIGDLLNLPMPQTKAILALVRLRSATLRAAAAR
jgi:ketopantoate reductase